jgi:hypothetical protein
MSNLAPVDRSYDVSDSGVIDRPAVSLNPSDRLVADDATDQATQIEQRAAPMPNLPAFFTAFRRKDGSVGINIVESALRSLVTDAEMLLTNKKFEFGTNSDEADRIEEFATAYRGEFEAETYLNPDADYGSKSVQRQKVENACYNIMSGAKFRHDGIEKVRYLNSINQDGLNSEQYMKLKALYERSARDGIVKMRACARAYDTATFDFYAAGRRVLQQNIKSYWLPLVNGENTRAKGNTAVQENAVQMAVMDIDG